MTDLDALSTAISKSRIIISILGPSATIAPSSNQEYADYYRAIFPLMRQHKVRRILGMGTLSIYQPDDGFSVARILIRVLVRIFANSALQNIYAIQDLFEKDEEATRDIDWTIYRIGNIEGLSDPNAWASDREDGKAYAGPLGRKGWTYFQKRAALAHWLADVTANGASEWISQMPAVSKLVE